MTIFLVRHGETLWNRERRHQGRLDSPLTRRGIDQARAVGVRLQGLPEAAAAPIVASPQGRARRSAEIIGAELAGPREWRTDARLRELTLGAWDGLTYREIEARSPGVFDRAGRWDWWFRAPGGEAYEAFAGRLGEWLAEQPESEPVIAVAHGLVSRVVRGLYAGLSRAAALSLPVPQNRIYRLSGGRIEVIAAAPLADAGASVLARCSKPEAR